MGYAKNENLKGLAIYDFSRLHSIEKIVTAPNIEYFSIGNKVWAKMDIESLKPLIQSNVSHFKWWGNKILDNDYLCLAQSKIRELDCKGKKTLVKGKDDEKLEKYLADFERLVEKYRMK